MSIFEFVLVMASLVMAIGVTLLLRHVAAIVRYRKTIELDWVPLTWMALQFVAITWVWWSLWDFADVEWTYPWFFYLLAGPTLQFIAISLLVSTDVSKPSASLSENFALVRAPFFLLLATFQVLVSWDGWIFGVEPFWNLLRSLQLVIMITYLVAASSHKRIVQKCAAVTVVGLYIYGLFFLRYMPGAFASS
jgi:hypothetical protein